MIFFSAKNHYQIITSQHNKKAILLHFFFKNLYKCKHLTALLMPYIFLSWHHINGQEKKKKTAEMSLKCCDTLMM